MLLFCGVFEFGVVFFFSSRRRHTISLCDWSSDVCSSDLVIDDECGAPEFFTHGAKLAGLPGVGAKLRAEDVAAYVAGLPRSVKQMPAKALSISQVTEGGMVYGLDEIAALGAVCREHRLTFHMDGARWANALVSLGCTPAEMTWKRGGDIL